MIMFGLNDSWIDEGGRHNVLRVSVEEYRQNLQQMAADLTARGISVILMTPNPADAQVPGGTESHLEAVC